MCGAWGAAVACVDSACVSGRCVGVCVPGHTTCVGGALQACTPAGAWQPVSACDAGMCDGGTVACAVDAGGSG